jgi:Tol biopolymer transport system component
MDGTVRYPRWSPNGDRIAFTWFRAGEHAEESGVYVLDLASGSHELTILGAGRADWAPTGAELIHEGFNSMLQGIDLFVYSVQDGSSTKLLGGEQT